MSIKRNVLATAAVLTLAGGLGAVGTVAASAATPQCGPNCIEIYNMKYATPASLGFVETVFLGLPLRGVPTIVKQSSSSDPAEDLILTGAPQQVSTYYQDGMVSAAVDAHFGQDYAVQIEYAPYGNPTGLCSALAVTAYQDEPLSLQPCSTPGTTVWILDYNDSQYGQNFYPIVNGSDTDFVHPFGMTILGDPAHQFYTPIIMQHLVGNPGDLPANQLWGDHFGVAY
jgi:hypothetical protein